MSDIYKDQLFVEGYSSIYWFILTMIISWLYEIHEIITLHPMWWHPEENGGLFYKLGVLFSTDFTSLGIVWNGLHAYFGSVTRKGDELSNAGKRKIVSI